MAKRKPTSSAAANTKVTTRSASKSTSPSIPSPDHDPNPNPIPTIATTAETVAITETTTSTPSIRTTRATRSQGLHAIDSQTQVQQPEDPLRSSPVPKKRKLLKRRKNPSRGVVIEEPSEMTIPEEVPIGSGKGKEKMTGADDDDDDWDIESGDDDACDTGSKKQPKSTKAQHPTTVELSDGEVCIVATVAPSLDKSRVIDILRSAGLTDLTLSQCIQLCEHPILAGRHYPQHWLQSEKAYAFFFDILKKQHWVGMVSTTSVIFVSEVIQFYQSVAVNPSGEMMTAIVNGKPFMISVAEMAHLLDVPNEGFEVTFSNSWPPLEDIGSLDVLRFFDPLAKLNTRISPGNLDGPQQFVYNFVRRTLTPRGHNRGHCSVPDLLLIFHLMTGRPINLAATILRYIKEVAVDVQKDIKAVAMGSSTRGALRKRDLPYGMWLTHLMWKKRVLSSEGYCVSLEDCMSDGVIGQMHLRIKNDKLVGLRDDGYSGAGGFAGLRGLQTHVRALQDVMTGGLESLAQDLDAIRADLAAIRADLAPLLSTPAHLERILARLPPTP